MSYPTRDSVRVVLLDEEGELLLMRMDDPQTRSIGRAYRGPFWTLIGGQVEPNESDLEAASRETFEETGISASEVGFGPVVWFGEFDMLLHGTPTRILQRFIVARTARREVSLANLTSSEMPYVRNLAWFPLDRIKSGKDLIYPAVLGTYLTDVVAGRYPDAPIEIDLAMEPVAPESSVDGCGG